MGLFSGIGDALGGVVGGFITAEDRHRSRKQYDKAVQDLMDSNPEAANSLMGGVVTDPKLRAAQMSALQGFQDEANAGGLTVQDRAALMQANEAQAARERGSREAILQNMSARGMGGSGAELAAALQNQQGSADRGAMAGTQAAADARSRALSALATSGTMAGNIRGQEFGEAAQKAMAQDAVNKFNASQRLSRANSTAQLRVGKAGEYNKEAAANMGIARGIGSGVGSVVDMFTGGFAVPSNQAPNNYGYGG